MRNVAMAWLVNHATNKAVGCFPWQTGCFARVVLVRFNPGLTRKIAIVDRRAPYQPIVTTAYLWEGAENDRF